MSVEPPAAGWIEDEADGDDEDTDPDSVFLRPEAWYVYDFTDHTLTTRDQVYVLETTAGTYVKVQLLGYYDGAGSPDGRTCDERTGPITR